MNTDPLSKDYRKPAEQRPYVVVKSAGPGFFTSVFILVIGVLLILACLKYLGF